MSYFTLEETACKCGCGLDSIDPALMGELEETRGILGFALIVNSGCRCVPYNALIGGKPDSAHTPRKGGLCKAADIGMINGYHRHLFLQEAFKRFPRIGIYETFIHVDIDEGKFSPVVWVL